MGVPLRQLQRPRGSLLWGSEADAVRFVATQEEARLVVQVDSLLDVPDVDALRLQGCLAQVSCVHGQTTSGGFLGPTC